MCSQVKQDSRKKHFTPPLPKNQGLGEYLQRDDTLKLLMWKTFCDVCSALFSLHVRGINHTSAMMKQGNGTARFSVNKVFINCCVETFLVQLGRPNVSG